MNLKSVDTPFKIRIWHNNKGRAPGWYLEQVNMQPAVNLEQVNIRPVINLVQVNIQPDVNLEQVLIRPVINLVQVNIQPVTNIHIGDRQGHGESGLKYSLRAKDLKYLVAFLIDLDSLYSVKV